MISAYNVGLYPLGYHILIPVGDHGDFAQFHHVLYRVDITIDTHSANSAATWFLCVGPHMGSQTREDVLVAVLVYVC